MHQARGDLVTPPEHGARSRSHPARIVPLGRSGSAARIDGDERRAARRAETTFGETLTDIVRMTDGALSKVSDRAATREFRLLRSRAVAGLTELRREIDARQREELRRKRLTESLRDLASDFQLRTRIFTEFRSGIETPIPDEIAWALYSVAAETFDGLERRSRATGVVMTVHATDERVSLSIRDDGVGLLARQEDGSGGSPHATIRAMRRTMELVGGAVTVTTARPRGLLVRVEIPLGVAV
jgi:signal transduction histidine kinase